MQRSRDFAQEFVQNCRYHNKLHRFTGETDLNAGIRFYIDLIVYDDINRSFLVI